MGFVIWKTIYFFFYKWDIAFCKKFTSSLKFSTCWRLVFLDHTENSTTKFYFRILFSLLWLIPALRTCTKKHIFFHGEQRGCFKWIDYEWPLWMIKDFSLRTAQNILSTKWTDRLLRSHLFAEKTIWMKTLNEQGFSIQIYI